MPRRTASYYGKIYTDFGDISPECQIRIQDTFNGFLINQATERLDKLPLEVRIDVCGLLKKTPP